MSFMIEVLYRAPKETAREVQISAIAKQFEGQLTCREGPAGGPSQSICLTYEFELLSSAEEAASKIRDIGEHVEGPYDYGD